jgi:hypothetical protein
VSVKLPTLLERLVTAINGGDTAAFLAFFPTDGVVDDWGDSYAGVDSIRRWNDRELIGAKGTLTVSNVSHHHGNEIAFDGDWKSSFFTGPGRFTLRLDGDRIHEMRIAEM